MSKHKLREMVSDLFVQQLEQDLKDVTLIRDSLENIRKMALEAGAIVRQRNEQVH